MGPSRKAGLTPGQLRAIMGLGAVALVVAYVLFGDAFKRSVGLPTDAPPAKAEGSVRVVSWNLRNFPGDDQDRDGIAKEVERLDADVLALQEVHDVAALEAMLPNYEFARSQAGGRGEQYLAIGVAKGGSIVRSTEHARLAMGGSVRPALAATVEIEGKRLEVLTVHLKATPKGYDLRQKQWVELDAVVEQASQDGDPIVVVGDFNTTGAPQQRPETERHALTQALDPLEPAFPKEGCSAYWEGSRRDAWKEPSMLDLGFASGVQVTATVGGTCSEHSCEPIRSTADYPDPAYESLSDHCPVIFDVRW